MRFPFVVFKYTAPSLIVGLGAIMLSACAAKHHSASSYHFPPTSPTPSQPQTPQTTVPSTASDSHALPSETVAAIGNKQQKMPTKLHKIKHQGIEFHLVSFDTRDYELQVADQPNGPGSLWSSAQAAAKKHNAEAAINAGFFTPEGKPLGLVIENGVKRGHYNASSLGKGIYYTTATGAEIKRSSHWRTILQAKPKHLLQAGPMLVDKGTTTRGLSNKSSRPRSFIATDGNNHWVIGHASSCTLSQLGKALTTLETLDFKTLTALNLDGGRSSDLFVNAEVANGPLDIRPFWNKPVRNFLLLKKK